MPNTYTTYPNSGNSYLFINSAGSFLVKNSQGVLMAIILGTKDALGTGALQVYDGVNNLGSLIMNISTGVLATPNTIETGNGINFATGLFVQVTAGLTPASITIIYS